MEITRAQKRLILMIVDTIIIYMSGYIAYFFLSEYIQTRELNIIQNQTYVTVLYLLVGRGITGAFSILNRYTDYKNLSKIALTLAGAYIAVSVIETVFTLGISYRFMLLGCMFSILFSTSVRLAWRIWYGYKTGVRYEEVASEMLLRTLVVGAGAGGSLFITTALKDSPDIKIVAVVDRDVSKHGSFLHGVKVVGSDSQIPEIVANYEINQIVIAIPSLEPEEYERILTLCKATNATVKAMPKYEEVVTGKVRVSKLREIDISDLLGRKEVVLDQTSLKSNIEGKTVLVTGAGGSIGSELCRQIARFNPDRLLLLGHGENSIYLIHKELYNQYGSKFEIIPVIADIQDRERIFQIMENYRPDRVYHAAAHKHVPLMEYNPKEAVKNNIYGTRNVAEAAKATGVTKFVMISTDKAVNPPNVMGATKRIAEMVVTSLNEEGKRTNCKRGTCNCY